MLSWTDCPDRTLEQQIILAQLEILHRLGPARFTVARLTQPRREP